MLKHQVAKLATCVSRRFAPADWGRVCKIIDFANTRGHKRIIHDTDEAIHNVTNYQSDHMTYH